ncbi:MAG TPA: hypothetical protein VGJ43_07500 [Acidimicrobiales bacterium]|jgi:hypothetical protein
MKRTITGKAATRRMTLGDVRQFLASIENVPDDAVVRARSTLGRQLRSLTVEEDDVGFSEYVRAVAPEESAAPASGTAERDEERKEKRKAGVGVS